MDRINEEINDLRHVELTCNGKGQKLYEVAKGIIPGGGQLLSKRPEMFLPDYWPAYYQKAKGCEIWDMDGNHYIDLSTMGIGSCTIGYADDEIDEAVTQTINNGNMSTLNAPEEVELAKLLLELHPWAEMARFARGGGDAMAIAVRIARASTKKDIILFSGYHGWHDWYLAANIASDSALDGQLLPGLNPHGVARELKDTSFPFFYNNTEEFLSLVEKYGDKIGGVVLEAVRGTNPEPSFFSTIERETKRLGVPLIVDEVTSGFRVTCGGAHLVTGLNPDIAVFAKGMSNGYAMAAIIGKAKYMDAAQDSFISSTFWTERIGPTAAIATIKKMLRENIQEHLIQCGKQMQEGWTRMANKHNLNIHISGIYPLSHLTFKDQSMAIKTLYIQEMLRRGFLVKDSYYSSFSHRQEHFDLYFKALDEVFGILADALKNNDVESRLKGAICQIGFKRLA